MKGEFILVQIEQTVNEYLSSLTYTTIIIIRTQKHTCTQNEASI